MPGRTYAVVCASNMNRSMEAHKTLASFGYKVYSFGTSSQVKLPGPSIDRPNVYEFGTPYQKIHDDLEKQDRRLYTHNGVLNMLKRNINVKRAPQRWHVDGFSHQVPFNVIITYEDRVFDAVVDDFMNRGSQRMIEVFVINLPTKDNHEAAAVAGKQTTELVKMLEDGDEYDWQDQFEQTIEQFEKASRKKLTYAVLFY